MRLRELDFLRGVAIILVLLRHQSISPFTTNMGWIGVDLFFVLSGFLVSGLLFKEFLQFGNIDPKRFLIRRGFKIYPIYYLFYIPYLMFLLNDNSLDVGLFLGDMLFLQNYTNGWGYAFTPSWSLAIEEHFYLALTLILWLAIKYNKISTQDYSNNSSFNFFQRFIVLTMILCFLLRLWSNYSMPYQSIKNFTMTHLRIDSLLAGVYISYLYHFNLSKLTLVFNNNKYLLSSIAILGLCWTPFIDPLFSLFAKTIGFTLLYFSFGIILLYFILTPDINKRLDLILGSPFINSISKIGYCSYSIYIINHFVNVSFNKIITHYNLSFANYAEFLITSIFSILLGILMTYKIESYFLRIRNQFVPNRIKQEYLS